MTTSYDSAPILAFQNIRYEISVANGLSSSKQDILKGVDGIMESGLNAIMGPSGCGKTSLLKILSGRVDRKSKNAVVSGNVLLNGKRPPRDFCRMCGYVDQCDNIFVETLSIRENMMFSANLALDPCIPQQEKSDRVDGLLETIGLKECSHFKIDDAYETYLSGGEKRRSSIAMALITDPKILFIDEPTSGLDASTASSIMILLDKLASEGRTIIFSIHQPRNLVFKLFNSITLLSYNGQVIYHGPRSQIISHCENIGLSCDERCNPMDVFSEILCPRESNTGIYLPDGNGSSNPDIEELCCGYYQSDIYSSMMQKIDDLNLDDENALITPPIKTSFFHQFNLLCRRSFTNLSRRVMLSFGNEVLAYLGFGIIFGLLFFHLGYRSPEAVQNRFGILFLTVNFNLFMSLSFIDRFTKEKHILKYEFYAGYYYLISYYLAKLFADFLPNRTLIPLILCTVSYWIAGLKAEGDSFFVHLMTVILVVYASVSVALFLAILFGETKFGDVMTFLIFLVSIFMAGLLVDIDRFAWLSWVKYLSVAYYGFSSLAINEFRNSNFTDHACLLNAMESHNPACTISGEMILAEQFGFMSDPSILNGILHRNITCLSGITLSMFTLSYFSLWYYHV